jgi:hypothetical protein
MKTQTRTSAPGITVRLPAPIREHVIRLARSEHRSAAAYIEQLVERDLREREEAERLVRVHVATGLPDVPDGQVTIEDGETTKRHGRRSVVLDTLFGVS